jgi:predicted HAD superfamily Cof-like phosphohydrolase
MKKALESVREFHKKHGFADREGFVPASAVPSASLAASHLLGAARVMTVAAKATISSPSLPVQRASLILEEVAETAQALMGGSLVDLADGLADLIYVALGTAVSYGIPIDRVFEAVHRSNMTKPITVDTLKPAKTGDFQPPDIAGALAGGDS